MNKFVASFGWKATVALLLAASAMGAGPVPGVQAAGPEEPPSPTVGTQVSNERLEAAWQRMGQFYARQGEWLERAGRFTETAQERIDSLKESGKDTASLQAALTAFKAELVSAQSVYASAGQLIASHPGFDSAGKVVDREQALVTLSDVRELLREAHQTAGEPGKALREAMRAFRESNRPEGRSSPQG